MTDWLPLAADCAAVDPYTREARKVAPIRPWASDDPPWSYCGDRSSPDFGTLFALPGARGSTILYFDRDERNYAMTVYAPAPAGSVTELEGRLWKVKRLPEAGCGFPNEAA